MGKMNQWYWLGGFIGSAVLHNLISGLMGKEEGVFFILSLVFLFGFLVKLINRWVKNWWMSFGVLILLLLDWLALDDITTGNEPDYIGEWVMLGLSLVIFLGFLRWKRKKQAEKS